MASPHSLVWGDHNNLCQVYKEQDKPREKHVFNTSEQSHSQSFYLYLEDGTTENRECGGPRGLFLSQMTPKASKIHNVS